MAKVVWLDEAIDQLDQIIAYIEVFDPPAANRIKARLIDVSDSLRSFPHRGRPGRQGSREMVTVSPYILRYTVIDETIFILGVRHARRDQAD